MAGIAPLHPCLDFDLAEGRAVRQGVNTALDLGFSNLIVEVDSLRVYRILQREMDDISELGNLLSSIPHFDHLGMEIRFQFIPREGNKAAHGLARLASEVNMEWVWIEDWPKEIADVVSAECVLF